MVQRGMTPRDKQAWVAMRMIGEAASRSQIGRPRDDHARHAVAGVRRRRLQGTGAHVRDWDRQLRQPILLADGRTWSRFRRRQASCIR